MLKPTDFSSETAAQLLDRIGNRIRQARTAKSMSRATLSELSGVSQRYLAQLEAGLGNISIGLLHRVVGALNLDLQTLFAPPASPAHPAKSGRIALVGLRGAGKSTLGPLLADRLGLPFLELNDIIRQNSGMPVPEVFALYGQEGYRRLERQALAQLATGRDNLVLAVAGGIVLEGGTFGMLRQNFHTVWLRANPEDHMSRVRAQGDKRPMAGNRDAMAELRSILVARDVQYARADTQVNTSGVPVKRSLGTLVQHLRPFGFAPRNQTGRDGPACPPPKG